MARVGMSGLEAKSCGLSSLEPNRGRFTDCGVAEALDGYPVMASMSAAGRAPRVRSR
jgi:hypothetical protein